MRSLWLVPSLAVCLAACQLEGTTQVEGAYEYGSKTPYQPAQVATQYQAAPSGFQPVYTEMLARHGSRAMSSQSSDDLTLQLWQAAEAAGALTELGKKLGPEVERLMAANQALGYGNLSKLGLEEHALLAQRFAARQHSLLQQAATAQRHVVVENSGEARAVASGVSFVNALKTAEPALASYINAPVVDKAQLYFHKQAVNQDYQNYIKSNPDLLAAISDLINQPATSQYAKQIMLRLYQPAFVQKLESGAISLVDHASGTNVIHNEVDAATALYDCYQISAGMKYEAGDTPWQFSQFLLPYEVSWFTYLDDGQDFYQKGPSFSDTTITYAMAKILEDDFFNEIEGLRNGTHNHVAKLRFAHAETIMPLATLMQLPGADQPVAHGALYTRQNNDWRSAWVSPYVANMQWDVYQSSTDQLIVTLLYNEKQVPFKAACQPLETGSLFYDFDELKRCYAE